MYSNNHETSRHGRSGCGTVLVVDDDTLLLVTIADALRADGYQVRVAASYAALRLSAKTRPDVILLGIIPPLHDAIAMGIYLRTNPLTAHIPVIAMATRARLDAITMVMPINGQLQFPIEPPHLSALVARLMPVPASRGVECVAYDTSAGT